MDGCYIIDTNIVVAGLIGRNPESPPAVILDAMLGGEVAFMLSSELLDEYLNVLQRPRIARLHQLSAREIDVILTALVANAVWREPTTRPTAPDPNDRHLWALLSCRPQACLVTGDQRLLDNPPSHASVITAREFLKRRNPHR